jgi:hypothetical protein
MFVQTRDQRSGTVTTPICFNSLIGGAIVRNLVKIRHRKRTKRRPQRFTFQFHVTVLSKRSNVNIEINVRTTVLVNCVSLFSYTNLASVGIVEIMFEIKGRK